MSEQRNWSKWHTLALIALTIGLLLLGTQTDIESIGKEVDATSCVTYLNSPEGNKATAGIGSTKLGAKSCAKLSFPWTWQATMLVMLAFIVLAGHGATGRVSGFLIDPRNKMSLARFQIVGWTVVIVGTYFVLVVARVIQPDADIGSALNIEIPGEVWALLGISLASSTGSALILNEKKHKSPDLNERELTLETLAIFNVVKRDNVAEESMGVIVVNDQPSKARFADMFRGDETGNAAHLDMSKVQMFFFTVITLTAYTATLGDDFVSLMLTNKDISLPAFHESMVTLLGTSHGGYLAHKAIPHSKSA